MKWNAKTIELYGLIVLSIITLLALLAYTFVHTGGVLSEYVRPWWVGYVAAFGVEAAIITMSIRIGKLLRKLAQDAYKSPEGWLSLFWQGSTLLFVLAVSAAANIVEGHKVKYGRELTLDTIQDLDGLQIAIGVLATGLIPVVVFAMTEIISGEIKTALAIGVDALQPIAIPVQNVKVGIAKEPALLPSLITGLQEDAPDLQKPASVSEDAWQAWWLVAKEGKSQAEVAASLQKSIASVSRYCKKVEEALQPSST